MSTLYFNFFGYFRKFSVDTLNQMGYAIKQKGVIP